MKTLIQNAAGFLAGGGASQFSSKSGVPLLEIDASQIDKCDMSERTSALYVVESKTLLSPDYHVCVARVVQRCPLPSAPATRNAHRFKVGEPCPGLSCQILFQHVYLQK